MKDPNYNYARDARILRKTGLRMQKLVRNTINKLGSGGKTATSSMISLCEQVSAVGASTVASTACTTLQGQKHEDVQEMVHMLLEATVQMHIGSMYLAFDEAVKLGLYERNPLKEPDTNAQTREEILKDLMEAFNTL